MRRRSAQQLLLTQRLRLLTMLCSLKSNFLIETTASRPARCAQNNNNKNTKGMDYEE